MKQSLHNEKKKNQMLFLLKEKSMHTLNNK